MPKYLLCWPGRQRVREKYVTAKGVRSPKSLGTAVLYIYSSLDSTPVALCAFDCSHLFFTVVLSAPHHQPGTSFQLFQVGIPQISNSPQNLDFVRRFPRKSKKFINLGPTSENFWSPYFKTSTANLLKTFVFLNFPLLSF